MDAAFITNDVIGVSSDYYRKGETEPYAESIKIIVDNSKEVKGDFGVIAGYEPEAQILISDVADVKTHDFFIQGNDAYRINFIVKQTTGKTFVDVVRYDAPVFESEDDPE